MISVEFDNNSGKSLYVQLYEYLKKEISEGGIASGERLPSLRKLSKNLGVSITTVKLAYDQLIVEGYLESRPQSGYFAVDGVATDSNITSSESRKSNAGSNDSDNNENDKAGRISSGCDPASFDFVKWKKCMSSVLNETPERLLSEADRQGEPELRKEISSYLYKSRGVICNPGQVVVSAGTQQLVNHLARLLKMMGIGLVCTEDPGYLPVRESFRDWGFSISTIPVRDDGIEIEKLPVNIRTAVYVSPQNQFPTGAVMPVARRHQLLDWAKMNDSIIIEDDYNSELRYFGMPVPALQGLDQGIRVVYIGSFTSTLFPAVRISYMVLPEEMTKIYDTIKMKYDQTCSKTEQLTLALFMQRGYYQTNLRHVRKLYSRKLQETLNAIQDFGGEQSFITAENSKSGLNLILRIDTHTRTITGADQSGMDEVRNELAKRLIKSAAAIGLKVKDVDQLDHDDRIFLLFYYNQIPLEDIRTSVKEMIEGFRNTLMKGCLTMRSVYEVLRLIDGKPIFLSEHYERLTHSLEGIGMTVPFTEDELARDIDSLARENHITNHNIKMEVDVGGHSIMYLAPTHYPSVEQYTTGVRTDLFNAERNNPNIKMMDASLRDATNAEIKAKNLYEVLLVDRDGNITEGSRSNVFFIKAGKVYTSPAANVLLGVTRRMIIEIINDIGAELIEEPVSASTIDDFDAAFISGTSPAVLPISQIGDRCYNVNDRLLRTIMQKYDDLCRK